MQEASILDRLVLGYSPVLDRQRAIVATRLTVFPATPDTALDAAELLQALGPLPTGAPSAPLLRLPGAPGGSDAAVGVLLNVAGESQLLALLAAEPVPRVLVEVPAFLAADARHQQALLGARAAGMALALHGTPREPLPSALAGCFSVLVDEGEAPAPRNAALPRLRVGLARGSELDAALADGVLAAAGWPFAEPPAARPAGGKPAVSAELQTIVELINRVKRGDEVERLEAVLKNDPTLAFRLLRYINSPGFGLAVEVASFRHALMMLGYKRLERWLALLLVSAGKDASLRPAMFAAVRRGLLMEELVRPLGDADLQGEIFICGVFSLLDQLLHQPFDELLRSVPVPERVRQALLGEDGPFLPYLELVRAIEAGSVFDMRDVAARLMLAPGPINRALLTALGNAAALG